VVPNHPPEVIHRLLQRSLRSYEHILLALTNPVDKIRIDVFLSLFTLLKQRHLRVLERNDGLVPIKVAEVHVVLYELLVMKIGLGDLVYNFFFHEVVSPRDFVIELVDGNALLEFEKASGLLPLTKIIGNILTDGRSLDYDVFDLDLVFFFDQ